MYGKKKFKKKKKFKNFGEIFYLKTLNMQQEILQIFATVQNLHLKKEKNTELNSCNSK